MNISTVNTIHKLLIKAATEASERYDDVCRRLEHSESDSTNWRALAEEKRKCFTVMNELGDALEDFERHDFH